MPDGSAAPSRLNGFLRSARALRLGCGAGLVLGLFGVAAGPAVAADALTIQGSSTFSANILTPNQRMIEALSGQSLKIVGIRSDIGLLRLLARQAEFAVISTRCNRPSTRCGPTARTCPMTG